MRAVLILVAVLVAAGCYAAGDITLLANGKKVTSSPTPVLHEGHVYVPLRAAAEALGAEVKYDAAAKRVTVCRGSMCTFVLQREGITVADRLLIGIRQVAEALNAKVEWRGATRTVAITTSN